MDTTNLARAQWRKSSYSGGSGGNCVEVAQLADGLAVRNSNHPDAGTLILTPAETHALITGIKAGHYDQHT